MIERLRRRLRQRRNGSLTETVPDLLNAIRDAIWLDATEPGPGGYTNRSPMFSTIPRNLQREHLDRLIDLARGMLSEYAENGLDDYTRAHVNDSRERIARAMEAAYFRVD